MSSGQTRATSETSAPITTERDPKDVDLSVGASVAQMTGDTEDLAMWSTTMLLGQRLSFQRLKGEVRTPELRYVHSSLLLTV